MINIKKSMVIFSVSIEKHQIEAISFLYKARCIIQLVAV